jgi:hypothetical protein
MAVRKIAEFGKSRSVGRRCIRIIRRPNKRSCEGNFSLKLAVGTKTSYTLLSLISDCDPRRLLSVSTIPSTATTGITEGVICGECDNGLPSHVSTL